MIQSVRLQQFRSYYDAHFEFANGVNIIVGPNASGKTNLLEAILVLARGSSYRVKDADLLQFDTTWARLDCQADDEPRTIKIVASPLPVKTYEIAQKPYKRLSLQHSLPVVLFEPNHLQLLHGAPDQRRQYLDEQLSQTTPHHAAMLKNYKRVLAQRNALLKRAKKPTSEELFPWNLRLSELGASIARRRAELVDSINVLVGNKYQELSKTQTATIIEYQAQFPLDAYESQLLSKLEHNLAVDIMRGFTSAGPHREDFTAWFDGHPADETASRGEARTFILALKVIELELLAASRPQSPLLLLDDVFSELDAARRQALTEHLEDYQTFITTTDADVVHQGPFKSAKLIALNS